MTPYGIFIAFSFIIAASFVNLSMQDYFILFSILVSSLYFQKLWCTMCSGSYSLATHLTIIPILVALFFDCKKIHMILFAFAIACAIGRIGCYFAGCCSGKVSTSGIKYTNGVINQKTQQTIVYVYPTIFIEIILQFIIAGIVYSHSFGVILYGILNALLLLCTSYWRYSARTDNIYVPILSLLFCSFVVYQKHCTPSKLTFALKPYSIVVGIILAYITSNNINV
jgi:prolipoprotein diacylglyceryltransferase